MTRNGAAGSKLGISEPVAEALAASAPVAALGSTMVAHGLAYPHNLETALEMMDALRRGGAPSLGAAAVTGERAGRRPRFREGNASLSAPNALDARMHGQPT